MQFMESLVEETLVHRKHSMADVESSDQELLQQIVIAHSQGDSWIVAKSEWKLESIYDKASHCICKHFIIENCVIRNEITNKILIVGNVCVNHFQEKRLEVPKSSRISLKKLHQDRGGVTKANQDLVGVAVRLNILTSKESKWYNTARIDKKCRQRVTNLEFRKKINFLILSGFIKDRPYCRCKELAKPRQNSGTKKYFYSCY